MLDEKDLQAIAGLMDEKIQASESRMMERISDSESRMMEKLQASESRMMERISDSESRMMAMMEAYFEPRFQALGEQLQMFQEKMVPAEALEETEARVDVLEAVVKQHSREINELKMA